MVVKVYFTDRICMWGVNERISRILTINNVGRNRLDRTVKTAVKKRYPSMKMNNYEVIK